MPKLMPKLMVAALLSTVLVGNAPARKHRPEVRPAATLSPAAAFLATNARARGVRHTASGLQYRVLRAATGTIRPTDADVALITYIGKLTDGTVFDQSRQPTPLPVAGVVPGFAEALKLMSKGARYRVWIKPSLGYGDAGAGPIPPGSILVFDIDLIDVISSGQYRQLEQQGQSGSESATPATSPR